MPTRSRSIVKPLRLGAGSRARQADDLPIRSKRGMLEANACPGSRRNREPVRANRFPSVGQLRVSGQRARFDHRRDRARRFRLGRLCRFRRDAAARLPRRQHVRRHHVAPSGRFVYASNRGHDSVAVFRVDAPSGALPPARGARADAGRRTPRSFAIGARGDVLVVANQDSDSVVVFRVDAESGRLHPTSETTVPTPVCVKLPGRALSDSGFTRSGARARPTA